MLRIEFAGGTLPNDIDDLGGMVMHGGRIYVYGVVIKAEEFIEV